MRFCGDCGKEVPARRRFCVECAVERGKASRRVFACKKDSKEKRNLKRRESRDKLRESGEKKCCYCGKSIYEKQSRVCKDCLTDHKTVKGFCKHCGIKVGGLRTVCDDCKRGYHRNYRKDYERKSKSGYQSKESMREYMREYRKRQSEEDVDKRRKRRILLSDEKRKQKLGGSVRYCECGRVLRRGSDKCPDCLSLRKVLIPGKCFHCGKESGDKEFCHACRKACRDIVRSCGLGYVLFGKDFGCIDRIIIER